MYKSLITNKKLIISKIAIVLLSILPISMIVGNLALNLNIILIHYVMLRELIKFLTKSFRNQLTFYQINRKSIGNQLNSLPNPLEIN